MSEKSGLEQRDAVAIKIPKALYERIETYCTSKSITPDEFIFDAISEKLTSVHRERRRKQRL